MRSGTELRRVGLACLVAALVGCGDAAPPSWTRLTRDASWTRTVAPQRVVAGDGRVFRIVDEDGSTWLDTTVARGDWIQRTRPLDGTWAVPLGVRSSGQPASDDPSDDGPRPGKESLVAGERAFRHVRPPWSGGEWSIDAGTFTTLGGRLALRVGQDEVPPETATLRVHTPRSRREDGVWRIAADRFSGEALSVWPGETLEADVDVPTDATLRFATVLEPALYARSRQAGPVRFRVTLDGEPLFAHELADPTVEHFAWHAVPLPGGARRGARLALTVEGAFAYTAFFAPVVGPAAVGAYGERPWGQGRADVVVFLADTFRADSMAAYGGTLGVTPNLDRFAADALVFERAWSTGTFTLPAHVSMFAGLFPRQAGIAGVAYRLPEEVVTIAEHLAERGYRTGAVTESVIVSARLGLAQGFAWFDEAQGTLAATLERARAFLDADDGRPVFLFVHTYRTHLPYRVSDETRRALGERLGIESDFQTLRERLNGQLADPGTDPAAVARTARALRAHYLGGVADLDRGFATFLDLLAERGLDESGYLVFTSDHGEGFGEHAAFYHTGPVWDELGRVPLLLRGPGLEPGVSRAGASLVDFATTMADMAGVAPAEAWRGTSWLSLVADRPIYVFECQERAGSTLAVVDGPHKVIGFEDAAAIEAGELFAAFDLDADPGERASVHAEAAWPRELFRRVGPAAALLLVPVVGSKAAALDPEKEAELRAMGYGGD